MSEGGSRRTYFLGRRRSRLAVQAAGLAAGVVYGLLLGGGALLMLMTGQGLYVYYLLGISPFLAGPFIWPIIGALVPVARTRTAFVVVLALLASHYAGAAILIGRYGAEAFAGIETAPLGLHLLAALVYLGGQIAIWSMVAWRYRRARHRPGARRPTLLQAAAAVVVAVLAMVGVALALPTPIADRQRQAVEAAAGVPLQELEPGVDTDRALPARRLPLALQVEPIASVPAASAADAAVVAQHPEGGTVEVTTAHDVPGSPSTLLVRRQDAPEGQRQLSFPGRGAQAGGDPTALAVDVTGAVHLVVADADPGLRPGIELYWLVGSLVSGDWREMWRVERGAYRTSRVELDAVSAGASVHLVWSERRVDVEGSGLFHLERGPAGFTRTLRVLDEAPDQVAVAAGPAPGDLWLAYADGSEVYLLLRRPDGRWSATAHVGTAPSRVRGLTLETDGELLEVRADGRPSAAWQVRLADGAST